MKRCAIAIILTALLSIGSTCAETYMGTTIAQKTCAVTMPSDGYLTSISAEVGQMVEAGQCIANYRTEAVYATQDGTVATIKTEAGQSVGESVLELSPESRYTIWCTVDDDSDEPDTMYLHSGETLYIKCKSNGTHRAVGVVTAITEDDYKVCVIGGELYVGEVVKLYRDSGFDSDTQVGIGTVVNSDTEVYTSEGTVDTLYVEEGDAVERGQLLYTVRADRERDIVVPTAGIITEMSVREGDRLKAGDAIVSYVSCDSIVIEFTVEEDAAAGISKGDRVELAYALNEDEILEGRVISVSEIKEGDGMTVLVKPDQEIDRIGMTAQVRIG